MRHSMLIGLILTFICSLSLGQDHIEERLRIAYRDAGWNYSIVDSAYVEYQVFDTIFSPDKKFKVLIRAVGLSDNIKKSQYSLIRTEQKDTTELTTAFRHDFPPPNFFWTSCGYLIYEKDSEQNSKIQMHNLVSNRVDFSTTGFLPIESKWSHEFYDKENEILIFYKPGTRDTNYMADLLALYIRDKTIKNLMTFKAEFDLEYPIISLDKKKRKLKVEYQDFTTSETPKTFKNVLDY